jgi:hypothetical protein
MCQHFSHLCHILDPVEDCALVWTQTFLLLALQRAGLFGLAQSSLVNVNIPNKQ